MLGSFIIFQGFFFIFYILNTIHLFSYLSALAMSASTMLNRYDNKPYLFIFYFKCELNVSVQISVGGGDEERGH